MIHGGKLWFWRFSDRGKGSNYGTMEQKGGNGGSIEGNLGIFENKEVQVAKQ